MPIKNYTTKVPANRSISQIQDMLVAHGAKGILTEYEKDTGRLESLKFILSFNGKDLAFNLPVNWRKFQEVLRKQNIKRWSDEDYVYRVAWRNLRDWVDIQMALYETKMAEIEQIFLPYAVTSDGQTFYEKVLSSNMLLGEGEE